VVAVAAAMVLGCAGQGSSPSPLASIAPPPSGTAATASHTAPASAPAGAASSPTGGASSSPAISASPSNSVAPSIAGPSYDNPVYDHDFPDPAAIPVDTGYFAYSTNSSSVNIPVIESADLATWEQVGDAMPALPKWAALGFGNTWAPGVIQIGDSYVMYFVDHDQASNFQCIGVATATTPQGSFHDENDSPFICQTDLGGSIDPFPFEDTDGSLHLLWKNDGNCCGKPVIIWSQKLSADGSKLLGQPTEMIKQDQAWEIPLVENPAVVANAGKYYLFYSANRWDSRDYSVGYALCESISGPCVKPQSGPIFQSTNEARGPGGESFVTDADGNLWMLYHAWTGSQIGYPQGKRSLRIDPLTFAADGTPQITGPTTDPEPFP